MLKQAEKKLRDNLSFERISLESDYYCFINDGFRKEISEHADRLEPNNPAMIPPTDLFSVSSEVQIVETGHQGQLRLCVTGTSADQAVSDFRRSCRFLCDWYANAGTRAFFAPKMDKLAPSGHTIRFEGIPEEEKAQWIKALNGIARYAKEMTAVFCRQVNSYKRITPKVITEGWRIPYLKQCLVDSESLHALADYQTGSGCCSFYLADHYCDEEQALTALFMMMLAGSQEDIPGIFYGTEERMPNSLAVALEIWKTSSFAKKVFGDVLHREIYDKSMVQWLEYCDVAHPWELIKGADYEEQ